MGFIKEFKEFATKGNVMELAVGIIIGSAFGKIVSSLVADIIMPPIGFIVGGTKLTDLKARVKKCSFLRRSGIFLRKNRLEIFSAQVAKLTGVFINERSE